jgi:hypothetical protein
MVASDGSKLSCSAEASFSGRDQPAGATPADTPPYACVSPCAACHPPPCPVQFAYTHLSTNQKDRFRRARIDQRRQHLSEAQLEITHRRSRNPAETTPPNVGGSSRGREAEGKCSGTHLEAIGVFLRRDSGRQPHHLGQRRRHATGSEVLAPQTYCPHALHVRRCHHPCVVHPIRVRQWRVTLRRELPACRPRPGVRNHGSTHGVGSNAAPG